MRANTHPGYAKIRDNVLDVNAPRRFLTAEWRYLVMLNYGVDAELLLPYVPRGTELDSWNGATYLSVVGFHFRNTRLLGVPVPFHRHFEEVNLRFYVRREADGELRRAVTFIKELVPRRAIAAVARLSYNEPYLAVPMGHVIGDIDATNGAPSRVEYSWRFRGNRCAVTVVPSGEPALPARGSEEEFITEHYWGYTKQRDGGTVEYRVEHPSWRVWAAKDARLQGDVAPLYGDVFARALRGAPASAFLAEGSPISVFAPTRLQLGP